MKPNKILLAGLGLVLTFSGCDQYDKIISKVPVYGKFDNSVMENHIRELDEAEDKYKPGFNRWEAHTLYVAGIDPAFANELREKYGDKIGVNDIILAKEQAMSGKELESLVTPTYSEDHIPIQPKSFNFRDDLRDRIAKDIEDALKYVPKDIPYRFKDIEQQLQIK